MRRGHRRLRGGGRSRAPRSPRRQGSNGPGDRPQEVLGGGVSDKNTNTNTLRVPGWADPRRLTIPRPCTRGRSRTPGLGSGPAWRRCGSGRRSRPQSSSPSPALRNRRRAAPHLGRSRRNPGEGSRGAPSFSPSPGVPRSTLSIRRALLATFCRLLERSRCDGGHDGGQRVKVLLPAASAVDTSPSWIRGTRKFMRGRTGGRSFL